MRFSVQNIADWILDYLFESKSEQDDQLHWIACNSFMTRDEITGSPHTLKKFSTNYERAIDGLKDQGYIFHNEFDNLMVYSEIDRKYIRPLKAQVKIVEKIKCFYIAEFPNGCKVGLTTNMRSRVRIYTKPWSRPVKQIKVLLCENPLEIENHIKKCFENYKQSRSAEFFNVSLERIEKEVLAFSPFSIFENYDVYRND